MTERLLSVKETRYELSPRSMSIDGAAAYLGVSRRTIERYIEAGKLKTRRLPAPDGPNQFLERTLISRAELDRLFEAGVEI